MIVDSHCHLDDPTLYDQLDNIINRADKNNIKYLLTICTTILSFKKIDLIVKKYSNVYGTFGIHPHETQKNKKINSQDICSYKKKNDKIIGIGETGLDYYYDYSDREVQKKSFVEHIKAASELNIPLIVHSRNAENDIFDILNNEKKNSKLKVLIHCFTGTKSFAKKLIDIDCYISISGIITFKNSTLLSEAASYIPLEKLLVETDSPYLAPIPLRGKSNEPSYIIHTLEKLALIKKITTLEIEKKTTSNFFKLFNLN